MQRGSNHRGKPCVRTAASNVALLIAVLGAPRVLAADPHAHLTVLDADARISRKSSFTITWTSTDIPPNTALSLRLYWKMADSGVRIGGIAQSGDTSRLLTTVLDAAAMKAFLEKFKSNATFSTIETGSYVWDVAKFCAQNTENGHSVCDSAPSFHLQLILRASNDPCADNVRCDKPRTLFKTELSRGAISFIDAG
jgi:mannose-1-phosphate guanylyltransferase